MSMTISHDPYSQVEHSVVSWCGPRDIDIRLADGRQVSTSPQKVA